ncbi:MULTISPECIES: MFS transporter [Exiguobacterium]|uniref:MFS transporter n=1 Tax=Exiguobacterium TaxID=33986 RepID=UPI001BE79DAA|nr:MULTISPECIES: MFS transporter [Exiguobacterium]MCT4783569.1 MFS transporter [Exiguobacterium himgiriensis]
MKSFYTLLVSQWLANIGDVLYIVALIALLYQQTGSALAAASFPITVTVGMTVSGLFFARVLSRFTLGQTLLVTQLLKTVLLLAVLWSESILVLGLVVLIAFLDGFARPVQASFIPRLTTNRQRANSLVQGSNQFIQLAMWPLGTIVVTSFTSNLALTVALMLFALSTFVTFQFVRSLDVDVTVEGDELDVSFKESLDFVRTTPFVRTLTVFVTFESFVSTLWISALLLVYLERHLHIDTGWRGTMNASFLVSMILASAYLYRSQRTSSLGISSMLSVGTALLFGVTSHIVFALIALAIQGYATQLRIIQTNTVLQETTPAARLPYVYSVQQTAYTFAFSIGSLTFGMLADGLPIAVVYLMGAALTVPLVWIGRQIDQTHNVVHST